MRVLVQVQDIKDPIEYTLEFLQKVSLITEDIEVLFLLPKIAQARYKEVNIPFKYHFILIDEYLCLDIQRKIDDTILKNTQLQQKVLEKLGVVTNFLSLSKLAMGYYDIYNKYFESFKPDFCVCWNGQVHLDQTCFRDLVKEKNIPTIFLERGLVPKSVFYDYQGVNATSSPVSWTQKAILESDYDKYYKNILDYVSNKGISIVNLTQQEYQNFVEPYILFPLQRDSDSNLVINSPYFKNMYAILRELNQIALPMNVHYRYHPEDPKTHYTKHLKFNNPKLMDYSNFNLEKHLDDSELVITVNSTIGFSALLKDKKVLALGNSIYSHKGMTVDYQNFESLEKAMIFALNKQISAEERILKECFISQLIIKNHLIFEENDLGFEQVIQLKNMFRQLKIKV